jgi:hypothetical protein
MKSILILILCCFVGSAAIAIPQQTQSTDQEETQTQTQAAENPTTSTSGDQPTPSTNAPKLSVSQRGKEIASFKGKGSQTTKAFSLNSGKATFDVVLAWEKFDDSLHKGEGDFTVYLVDETGKNVDMIIGTIDHFDGARTLDVEKAGKYMLKVTAPGNWTVSVHQ